MNALKIEECHIIKFHKALEGSTVLLEFLDENEKVICKKTLKPSFWSTLLKGNISMEPNKPTFLFKIRCRKETIFLALRYTFRKKDLVISNTKRCIPYHLFPHDTMELDFNFRLTFEDQ